MIGASLAIIYRTKKVIGLDFEPTNLVGVLRFNFVMEGAACRGPYFCLVKSKPNRVLRKTRAQGKTLKNNVSLRLQHLNIFLLTQTVAQDE